MFFNNDLIYTTKASVRDIILKINDEVNFLLMSNLCLLQERCVSYQIKNSLTELVTNSTKQPLHY